MTFLAVVLMANLSKIPFPFLDNFMTEKILM